MAVQAQDDRWPGQAWVQLRYPASPQSQERDDLVVTALAQQEAQLLEIGPGVRLNAKVRAAYVRDTKELNYNNKAAIGLGLDLQAKVAPFVTVFGGWRQEWEHRHVTDRGRSVPVGYAGWNVWTDLQPSSAPDSAPVVISSWAEARYPSAPDPVERKNAIVEGAVALTAPLAGQRYGPTLQFATSFDFKADTEGLEWNNQLSPGVGAKIALPIGSKVMAEVGAKYVADYRYCSDRFRHGPAVWAATSARW